MEASPLQEADESIHKVNDGLFYAKKHEVFFVMERLTQENLETWEYYCANQYDGKDEDGCIGNKLKTNIDILLSVLNLQHNLKFKFVLDGDHGVFFQMMRFYRALKNCPTCEMWIAYVLSSEEAPNGYRTKESLAEVELCFAVSTEKDAPVTSHMGIQRSRLYIHKHLEERLQNSISQETTVLKHQWHERISIPLHAFAAKVMLLRGPTKKFMINVPMFEMKNIMIRALPTESVWIGTKSFHAKDLNSKKTEYWGSFSPKLCDEPINKVIAKGSSPIKCTGCDDSTYPRAWKNSGIPNDFSWTLYDKDENILLQFDASSLDIILTKYLWLFMAPYMSPDEMAYLVIDLTALSMKF